MTLSDLELLLAEVTVDATTDPHAFVNAIDEQANRLYDHGSDAGLTAACAWQQRLRYRREEAADAIRLLLQPRRQRWLTPQELVVLLTCSDCPTWRCSILQTRLGIDMNASDLAEGHETAGEAWLRMPMLLRHLVAIGVHAALGDGALCVCAFATYLDHVGRLRSVDDLRKQLEIASDGYTGERTAGWNWNSLDPERRDLIVEALAPALLGAG